MKFITWKYRKEKYLVGDLYEKGMNPSEPSYDEIKSDAEEN